MKDVNGELIASLKKTVVSRKKTRTLAADLATSIEANEKAPHATDAAKDSQWSNVQPILEFEVDRPELDENGFIKSTNPD